MSRLLFVTQVIDPEDPILGVSVDLASALATRCDELVVIANEVRGNAAIDAEVLSLGKERGAGRAERARRYIRTVRRQSRGHRHPALVAHMCPVYLNLAAPVGKLTGLKLVLWYAHPGRSFQVRMAARLADVVLTSLPGAFPFPSGKLREIGQAVDVDAFAYAPPAPADQGLRLLALGRTSPVKGYPTLVRGVAVARDDGLQVHLRIVAPSSTPAERSHRSELERLIADLRLSDCVTLEPPVPRAEIPAVLRSADLIVNATRTGSGDKTVFESMAAGRPVILSNRSFARLVYDLPFEALFQPDDHNDLARRISEFARLPWEARLATGEQLRARIVAGHSLEHWADKVVEAASS